MPNISFPGTCVTHEAIEWYQMDELIQQFLDLLQIRVTTLGEEPVRVVQVVWLIGTLVATLVLAGFCDDGAIVFSIVSGCHKTSETDYWHSFFLLL